MRSTFNLGDIAPIGPSPELDSLVGFEATWSPHSAEIETDSEQESGILKIVLSGVPHEDGHNQMYGTISRDLNEQGLRMAMIGESGIDEEYQGQGIGAQMYRAFTRLAIEHGATHIGGIAPSAAAMRARVRVFGLERMKFYEEQFDDERGEVLSTKQEISIEECQRRVDARERLESYMDVLARKYGTEDTMKDIMVRMDEEEVHQLESYEDDKDRKSFSVLTDLSGLDVSGWTPYVSTRIIRR